VVVLEFCDGFGIVVAFEYKRSR